jgi:hypothetical protein
MLLITPDLGGGMAEAGVEIKGGQARAAALEMGELDANHAGHGGSEASGDDRPIQIIPAGLYVAIIAGDDQCIRPIRTSTTLIANIAVVSGRSRHCPFQISSPNPLVENRFKLRFYARAVICCTPRQRCPGPA